MQLYTPITENLKLDMRMNLKSKKVEIKTTPQTTNPDVLQKAADFVHAYILGGSPVAAGFGQAAAAAAAAEQDQ